MVQTATYLPIYEVLDNSGHFKKWIELTSHFSLLLQYSGIIRILGIVYGTINHLQKFMRIVFFLFWGRKIKRRI